MGYRENRNKEGCFGGDRRNQITNTRYPLPQTKLYYGVTYIKQVIGYE